MFDGEALKWEKHGGDVFYDVNVLFLLPKRAPSESLDTNSRQLRFNGRHALRSGRVLSVAAAESGVDVSCLYCVRFLLYIVFIM